MDSENVGAAVILMVFVGAVLGFVMLVLPIWSVWNAEQIGRAELSQADYSKQVAVQIAKAKADSAQYEAQAEITRAGGVAQANIIIGKSLKDNQVYLQYLWVNALNDRAGQHDVIYVPTDGVMPIMEAGRAVFRGNQSD